MFASRRKASGRQILNEQELLEQCSALQPPAEAGRLKRVKCISHAFGRDMWYDLALAEVRGCAVLCCAVPRLAWLLMHFLIALYHSTPWITS